MSSEPLNTDTTIQTPTLDVFTYNPTTKPIVQTIDSQTCDLEIVADNNLNVKNATKNNIVVLDEGELVASLLDDESESDEETINLPKTRKDYKALNCKLNMLFCHPFLTSNFYNMMLAHEASVETFLSQSKQLSEENKKVVKESVMMLESALQEVKDLKTLILNDNFVDNLQLTSLIDTLVHHYNIEAHLIDDIQRKEVKIKSLKKKVTYLKSELVKKEDELLFVQGRCNIPKS